MLKQAWFWLLKNTLNRLTVPAARAGRGPFALVQHVGRRSGRRYETPLLLARLGDGFVAELTYGPTVDWYRNVTAAGHCTVIADGIEYEITHIETVPAETGLRAFGHPAAWILRLLRRTHFCLLRPGPRPSA